MAHALNRSVFARLVVIMVVMAALLLLLVGGFYLVLVLPSLSTSVTAHIGPHFRAIADTEPNFEEAQRFVDKLEMDMRFEGEGGSWSTDPRVPNLATVQRMQNHGFLQHFVHFFHAPVGAVYVAETARGTYIFAPRITRDLAEAHRRMLLLLLGVMAVVLGAAYLVLKRGLQPLRLLDAGVKQLSEGQLDVTVEKRTEDEFGELTDAFNHMARRVRAMVQGREQLLLDVSHELRSPLTRLRVAVEMMPEASRRASMIADLQEMESMVHQLLEWHRLQDPSALRTETLDLVALVGDVCERHRDRSPGLRLTAAPERLFVQGEADRIRTVVREALDNAFKYALPDSQPVEIEVRQEADGAVVEVADDGPGLPAASDANVFEPFFRGDPSRSKKTGGYGLGLSICRRTMEAHGGSIRVHQRQPRGTIVRLVFPVPRTEPAG